MHGYNTSPRLILGSDTSNGTVIETLKGSNGILYVVDRVLVPW